MVVATNEKKFTVEGLPETQEYDVFSNLKDFVKGVEGGGKITLPEVKDPFTIKYTASKVEGLKNGEVVKIKAEIDAEEVQNKGFKVSTLEKDITIENLSAPQAFDPFAEAKFEVTGFSGDGEAKVTSNAAPFNISYALSKKSQISNGEEITVKAEFDSQVALNNGYIVSNVEKIFKAEGLKEYKTYTTEDLFKYAKADFKGVSPHATLSLSNNLPPELKSYITFEHLTKAEKEQIEEMEKRNYSDKKIVKEYKERDTLKLFMIFDDNELKRNGISITGEKEKSVVLDKTNIPVYISDVSQIPIETRKELIKEAGDIAKPLEAERTIYYFLEGHGYRSFDTTITISNIEKIYLVTFKPGRIANIEKDKLSYSKFIVLHKGTFVSRDKKTYNVLVPVILSNISRNVDGTVKPNYSEMTLFKNDVYNEKTFNDLIISPDMSNYTITEYTQEDFLK